MLSLQSHPPRPVVGLVLGAGGVRGSAHAAVIQVLRDAEIPIDLVVGASVGSLYALAVAAGIAPETLVHIVRSTTPMDLIRFYAGRLRPGRSNPVGRLLLETGAGKEFSDLELPLAVMATDVFAGSTVAFTTGPVLPAVQASIALPFFSTPVEINGRYYVDGGLLETLPVGVARAMGADLVIGVCLGYNYHAPAAFRRRLWTRAVLERVGRQNRRSRVPTVDQVRFFARLCVAAFDPPPPSADADVTIWPEVNHIGTNSPTGSAFCFEQGMEAARAALPRIERLLTVSVHNAGQT